MTKYYDTHAGELYRATLWEYACELSKPTAEIDWNKAAELSDKAAAYFRKAMGEA